MSTLSKPNPKVIYEDTHLMVISKPAGLLSQGEHTGDENLVDWARAHVGRNYIGLIHRLDRNTSGVMVLAKRTKAAQRLTAQLQNGELTRRYRALLIGKIAPNQPVKWSHYIQKDERTNTVRVVQKSPQAKLAVLNMTPLQNIRFQGAEITLAEFQLETGRSHQIRVQAAKEGFPLLGDQKYGIKAHNGNTQSAPSFPRPALHSYLISFKHPMSQDVLEFKDDLPGDMAQIIMGA